MQSLATHGNVHGIKDSSGDLETRQRYVTLTADADFDVLVGSESVYAPALDAGAAGGVLALAGVRRPRVPTTVPARHGRRARGTRRATVDDALAGRDDGDPDTL